jgi:tetratricopeptide (TPR) repeat protein
MTDVSEAILRDPRNPDSYLLRARLYQQKGEHSLAMTDYTSASALAPNSEKSYLARATVFQADGQPQRALEDCEQAVRVNPNSSAGYLCRAEAYIKMNAPGRAVEEVNRALLTAQTLNQQLPLLTELAQAMPAAPGAGEKQVAKDQPAAAPVAAIPPVAVAVTQPPRESTPAPAAVVPQPAGPAVQMPPAPSASAAPNSEDARRLHLLGREQNSQENFEPALNLLNRAIELDPWLASAYNARGYAYLRLTKFDRAVADFSEAIRLQPNYINAYVNRSVARKHMGDSSGAVADQRKAAQLIAGDQPAAPKPPLSASR